MKKTTSFSRFWLPLLAVSCGADYIDFREDPLVFEPPANQADEDETNGTESGNGTDTANATGGQPGFHPLLPGGYAGGFQTVSGLARGDTFGDQDPACRELQGVGFFSYDTKICEAGTICELPCQADTDCQLGTDHPEHGWIEAQGQCVPYGTQSFCHVQCSEDADCPQGLICREAQGRGMSCLFPDVPWAPGCDESYCMREGQQHAADGSGPFYCDVHSPCCEGLSCSPSGTCQDRSCLPASWSCSAGSAPCCDGLSCQNGYCQPQ